MHSKGGRMKFTYRRKRRLIIIDNEIEVYDFIKGEWVLKTVINKNKILLSALSKILENEEEESV